MTTTRKIITLIAVIIVGAIIGSVFFIGIFTTENAISNVPETLKPIYQHTTFNQDTTLTPNVIYDVDFDDDKMNYFGSIAFVDGQYIISIRFMTFRIAPGGIHDFNYPRRYGEYSGRANECLKYHHYTREDVGTEKIIDLMGSKRLKSFIENGVPTNKTYQKDWI